MPVFIGFDKNSEQVITLKKEAGDKNVFATLNLDEVINALSVPAVIIMPVPSGKVVDDIIIE